MREQVDYALHRRAFAATVKSALDWDSGTLAYCKGMMREAAEALLVGAKEAGAVRPEVGASDLLRLAHGIGYASEHADRQLSYLLDGLCPPSVD